MAIGSSSGRPALSSGTLTILWVSAPTANTEVSQVLADATTAFTIKVLNNATSCKFSFVATESGTKYQQFARGSSYNKENVTLVGKTLYMQTPKAGQTIIVEQWT